ncbi:MAG: hypothetical protein AMR96_03380 [Candidatus Adiutrix intracellularis]|jgi:ABC-type Zn uptake system ZnuABC Zn-binding protein ZnuA|nr:MAG: hypothetical protein AMR96_03380 [Candidatus Adiutrix intracellularis]MDR2826579.1 metal ABC transporter substrate-binding protein [Candidatus Adiutrix intracellularis]
MKKLILILRSVVLILVLVLIPARLGWARQEILVTIFPIYLFTRNILEGGKELTSRLLVTAAGCPHDHTLTSVELECLSQADFMITGGLRLETFLKRALSVAKPGLKIIDASAGLPGGGPETALIINLAEAQLRFRGREEGGVGPHFFAAPGLAASLVRNIAAGLAVIDPDRAEIYRVKADKLAVEFQGLGDQFATIGVRLGHPPVMISHESLAYIAAEMGLPVVAIIESEDEAVPSVARLLELSTLAREAGVRAILADPGGRVDLARLVGVEAKLPVVLIDPVASGPDDAPLDYYQKIMFADLQVLEKLFTQPPTELDKPEDIFLQHRRK